MRVIIVGAGEVGYQIAKFLPKSTSSYCPLFM